MHVLLVTRTALQEGEKPYWNAAPVLALDVGQAGYLRLEGKQKGASVDGRCRWNGKFRRGGRQRTRVKTGIELTSHVGITSRRSDVFNEEESCKG